MKRLNKASYGVLKGVASSLLILLLALAIAYEPENKASEVFVQARNQQSLNEDNLVTMLKQYTSTQFLHKVKLTNGEVELQLHFESMLKLVEHLEPLTKEYLNFYFNHVSNINKLTILISEDAADTIVYQVKMSKTDYRAGKQIEIDPL